MNPSIAAWIRHPTTSMVAGLVFYPLAHLAFVTSYVFNFLATLVHELGHALAAWFVGGVGIPTVGIFGGGVSVHHGPFLVLQVLVAGGLGFAAWTQRARRPVAIGLGAAAALSALLGFSGAHETFIASGGILLELGGAGACFVVAVSGRLERPFERPLYALWGWWMWINRVQETWLLWRRPGHWEEQEIYESGLAAGLVNDMHRVQEGLGLRPAAVCGLVLALALLVLPAAALISWRRLRNPSED